MLRVETYFDESGGSPFERWFEALDPVARAKVTATLYRMEQGNLGDVKALGGGVHERRIHWGPGLRIYFGRQGTRVIVLLGGGTKSSQHRDVETAKRLWKEYVRRQRG